MICSLSFLNKNHLISNVMILINYTVKNYYNRNNLKLLKFNIKEAKRYINNKAINTTEKV